MLLRESCAEAAGSKIGVAAFQELVRLTGELAVEAVEGRGQLAGSHRTATWKL